MKNYLIRASKPAFIAWLLSTLMFADGVGAAPAHFSDPLGQPAVMSRLATSGFISAVASAGNRLVAVGPRGHILLSDDAGMTWQQTAVPVSTDLVAVHFANARKGWVVGHDSVILHTADGGQTWTKQLDGRSALKILLDRYAPRASTDARAAAVMKSLNVTIGQSATPDVFPLPLLDVWFRDENHGFAIGAFNLIFHTTDGGKSWEPWQDRVDNPNEFNLHAVRGHDGRVYVVGERGLVLKLDRASERFTRVALPYEGSLFGLIAEGDQLLVFGDAAQSFQKLDVGTTQALTSGLALQGGHVMLLTQGGTAHLSDATRTRFKWTGNAPLGAVQGAAQALPSVIAIATARGVARLLLP